MHLLWYAREIERQETSCTIWQAAAIGGVALISWG